MRGGPPQVAPCYVLRKAGKGAETHPSPTPVSHARRERRVLGRSRRMTLSKSHPLPSGKAADSPDALGREATAQGHGQEESSHRAAPGAWPGGQPQGQGAREPCSSAPQKPSSRSPKTTRHHNQPRRKQQAPFPRGRTFEDQGDRTVEEATLRATPGPPRLLCHPGET